MQTEQTKLDSFIGYIKNISLHFQNLIMPNTTDLKSITIKTIKIVEQFDKFVKQYNKKVIQQMKMAKINVPFIFYRTLKDHIDEPSFMKYSYRSYELKYVFIRLNVECHVHIQITKKTNGQQKSSLAFQKLENTFTYMIMKLLQNPENQATIMFFQTKALKFLQEVYRILNGEDVCVKCRKSFLYHQDLKVILPPTVRLMETRQKGQDGSLIESKARYAHQVCL